MTTVLWHSITVARGLRKRTQCLEKHKENTESRKLNSFWCKNYDDISQSVTACSLGTKLVSSFSIPWSQTPKLTRDMLSYFSQTKTSWAKTKFVFAHEVFVWSDPCYWHNNLSNNLLTVPCCFYGIVFGTCWHVPGSFEYILSGSWWPVPCCFHTICYDGFFRISVFSVRHRFCWVRIWSLFSLHRIFYGKRPYKRPSCHSPVSDWLEQFILWASCK